MHCPQLGVTCCQASEHSLLFFSVAAFHCHMKAISFCSYGADILGSCLLAKSVCAFMCAHVCWLVCVLMGNLCSLAGSAVSDALRSFRVEGRSNGGKEM